MGPVCDKVALHAHTDAKITYYLGGSKIWSMAMVWYVLYTGTVHKNTCDAHSVTVVYMHTGQWRVVVLALNLTNAPKNLKNSQKCNFYF